MVLQRVRVGSRPLSRNSAGRERGWNNKIEELTELKVVYRAFLGTERGRYIRPSGRSAVS